jgi:hypothetical protein
MPIVISRNAVQFLRRHGLVDEPARPKPRLDVQALLVHTVPLPSPPMPGVRTLLAFEGDGPEDREVTRPWPGQ